MVILKAQKPGIDEYRRSARQRCSHLERRGIRLLGAQDLAQPARLRSTKLGYGGYTLRRGRSIFTLRQSHRRIQGILASVLRRREAHLLRLVGLLTLVDKRQPSS